MSIAPPRLIPNFLWEKRLAVLSYNPLPFGVVRERLAHVPHFVGSQKPQINKHHRESKFGQLPRPREAVGHLVVRVARELPPHRSGSAETIVGRPNRSCDFGMVRFAVLGCTLIELLADCFVDKLRIVRLGLDQEDAGLAFDLAGARDIEIGRL